MSESQYEGYTTSVADASALQRLSATALMGTALMNTALMNTTLTNTALTNTAPAETTKQTETEVEVSSNLVPDSNTPIIEENLLKKVASVSLQHQVASLALKTDLQATPTIQKEDELPYCSPQAIRRLRLMLEGRHTELTHEFLKLIQASKQRIPEIYAPNLLYRAHRQSALRPLVIPAFGEVAIKLAKSNPQWAFASLELNNWDALKDYWKSERSTNRRHLLSQLRTKAPEVALSLLESTWSKETPSAKTWYLRSMLENLSMADEAFLEAALDDRQHTVRKKAAETLTHLPESRLAKRMTEAAGNIIHIKAKGLELHFPVVNTAMIRDGIPQRWDKDTDKAMLSQMTEMISAIPLAHWESQLELSPEEIIEKVTHSEDHFDALVRGFSIASFRQGNKVWAKALLEGMPPSLHTTKLVNYLSVEDFMKVLAQWDDESLLLDKNNPKLKLLQRWSNPWSPELTQSVLEHIQPVPDIIDQSKPPPALVRQILKATATLAPVTDSKLLSDITSCFENFKKLSPAWENICRTVEETLAFRHEMYKEITERNI